MSPKRSGALTVGLVLACGLSPLACVQLLGIGDPQLDTSASGAMGGIGGVGGAGGATTSSAGGAGGAGPGPCQPTDPICNQVDSECLALVDNRNKTKFGLRVGQATMWKPDAFTPPGIEAAAIQQAVALDLAECYLAGGGTLSWLIEFDLGTDSGRVGASKPAEDPFQGYAFVDELVDVGGTLFNITPAQVNATLDADGTIHANVIDAITIPIYLDKAATQIVLVPLRKLRLFDAKLSADHNCIGSFNAWGLDPNKGCLPDPANGLYSFISGGKVDGYILLEEADDVIVTAFNLNRSLCVVLSQDASKFGDGGSPIRCERIDGQIKFPGDWCAATNSGADPGCYDAMQFGQNFAASAVIING